jgi:septation ring formation regulator EzrA
MLRAELEHVREYAANESRNASRAAAEARLVHENLEDQMRNLKAVREQLQERETGYVSLLTMLSTLRSALSVAKANSDATLEQLAATQKLLDETHSSNSWRLLAPARKAARKLRSLSFASKR